MGGRGGRLSILVREIVRFRGIELEENEDDEKDGGGGGGESPGGGGGGRKRGRLYMDRERQGMSRREGRKRER